MLVHVYSRIFSVTATVYSIKLDYHEFVKCTVHFSMRHID